MIVLLWNHQVTFHFFFKTIQFRIIIHKSLLQAFSLIYSNRISKPQNATNLLFFVLCLLQNMNLNFVMFLNIEKVSRRQPFSDLVQKKYLQDEWYSNEKCVVWILFILEPKKNMKKKRSRWVSCLLFVYAPCENWEVAKFDYVSSLSTHAHTRCNKSLEIQSTSYFPVRKRNFLICSFSFELLQLSKRSIKPWNLLHSNSVFSLLFFEIFKSGSLEWSSQFLRIVHLFRRSENSIAVSAFQRTHWVLSSNEYHNCLFSNSKRISFSFYFFNNFWEKIPHKINFLFQAASYFASLKFNDSETVADDSMRQGLYHLELPQFSTPNNFIKRQWDRTTKRDLLSWREFCQWFTHHFYRDRTSQRFAPQNSTVAAHYWSTSKIFRIS